MIYVYDNNSSDHTDEIAKREGAVVRYEHRQGKGNVIRRMFREIDAQVYIMVDGDDTYPAEFGRKMADIVLERHADMVVGDHLSSTYFEENKRPFHNFGNSLVRKSIVAPKVFLQLPTFLLCKKHSSIDEILWFPEMSCLKPWILESMI